MRLWGPQAFGAGCAWLKFKAPSGPIRLRSSVPSLRRSPGPSRVSTALAYSRFFRLFRYTPRKKDSPLCISVLSVFRILQKAENKSDLHKMRGIDFIYVLNLDERPEKFEKCAQQLALWNIVPYRFSAVNGWKLSLETVNDVGVVFQPWMSTGTMGTYYETGIAQHEFVYKTGRSYFCHCMSRGAVGIALSHLSILQDALDSGYETIWVMEDDIDVLQNPHILSDLIEKLDGVVGKEGWDILFTDQDTKNSYGHYVPCTGFAWRPNYAPKDPSRFASRMNVSPTVLRKCEATRHLWKLHLFSISKRWLSQNSSSLPSAMSWIV